MGRFTKVPDDTFKRLTINAGIMTTTFTPDTGEVTGIMAATTGGITFASNPTFEDFGDDIDNCPKNTMELKRITALDPVISGTMLTLDSMLCKQLMAAAQITRETGKPTKLVPTMDLRTRDFQTIWFIGDYSDNNSETNGGYVAIKLINALNTTGFQLTTTDKGKGQFAFEFHGHASLSDQTVLPFEIYIKGGIEGTLTDSGDSGRE